LADLGAGGLTSPGFSSAPILRNALLPVKPEKGKKQENNPFLLNQVNSICVEIFVYYSITPFFDNR